MPPVIVPLRMLVPQDHYPLPGSIRNGLQPSFSCWPPIDQIEKQRVELICMLGGFLREWTGRLIES